MASKHDWNSWDNYLAVHQRRLKDYEHFILRNELQPTPTAPRVYWSGVLSCQDGIEVHVSKEVEVRSDGRLMVRTALYSYHVLRREADLVINLFRYDNVHSQPGHPDAHHKQRFDDAGREIEPPLHVDEEGWPTFEEVLREAHNFWIRWLDERRRGV